uniref:Uncharacterized protein n=1 Tax=Zygnema circumcarinatum TaxID=35869 RepID=Q32RJ1_ZYGCR|nr:hypothetical protein P8547_pgp035 [Zygnema circumcarinatum]AAX45888.1 hypothetical protein [Zygnema circumcarinatum]
MFESNDNAKQKRMIELIKAPSVPIIITNKDTLQNHLNNYNNLCNVVGPVKNIMKPSIYVCNLFLKIIQIQK